MKAVIFDNDGVLLDSLDWHWLSYCEAMGQSVDRMEILTREGKRASTIISELTGWQGKKLADAVAKKEKAYRELAKDLAPREGVAEVIDGLRERGFKIGLATGTARKNVDLMLGKLARKFDAVVTADDDVAAKPSPEPYLRAAELLGVKPRDCIVVENAPLGITSAKKAGMRCIALTSTLPPAFLDKADMIINDIREVLECV